MIKRDEVPGLGQKLKAAREGSSLTQVQAAEVSGIHQVNISKFETGSKTPTLATLYKLAEAYGVNVCELLPGGVLPNADPVPPAQVPEAQAAPVPAKKTPKGGKKGKK